MPDFTNILTSTIHRNNITFLTLPLFKHLNVSLDLVAPQWPWDLVFHLSALTPTYIFNSPTFNITVPPSVSRVDPSPLHSLILDLCFFLLQCLISDRARHMEKTESFDCACLSLAIFIT